MKTVANAVVAADKSLDAQFSQNNGVLLQVAGTMKLQVRQRRGVGWCTGTPARSSVG